MSSATTMIETVFMVFVLSVSLRSSQLREIDLPRPHTRAIRHPHLATRYGWARAC